MKGTRATKSKEKPEPKKVLKGKTYKKEMKGTRATKRKSKEKPEPEPEPENVLKDAGKSTTSTEPRFKASLLPLVGMLESLYEIIEVDDGVNKKKVNNSKALRNSRVYGLVSPFYQEKAKNKKGEVGKGKKVVDPRCLSKIPQAMQFIIKGYDKTTKKFKFGTSIPCALTAEDFSLIFKMQRVLESEELLNELKLPSTKDAVHKFLNEKFKREHKDKLPREEIARKLKLAATNDDDPEYFLRVLMMWLGTVLFFTNSGATALAITWMPLILYMDEVSWPDRIVEALLYNIENPEGVNGSVVGCTPLLLYWFCEHVEGYIKKREGFENSTPRFLRWCQKTFCNRLLEHMKRFDHTFEEERVDGLLEVERPLILPAEVQKKLEEEKKKNKELEEENLEQGLGRGRGKAKQIKYVYERRCKRTDFVNSTIFLLNLVKKHKDSMPQDPKVWEEIARIDRIVKDEKKSTTHRSSEATADPVGESSLQNTTGESSADDFEISLEVQFDESLTDQTQSDLGTQGKKEASYEKGYHSGKLEEQQKKHDQQLKETPVPHLTDSEEELQLFEQQTEGTEMRMDMEVDQQTEGTPERSWQKGFDCGKGTQEKPANKLCFDESRNAEREEEVSLPVDSVIAERSIAVVEENTQANQGTSPKYNLTTAALDDTPTDVSPCKNAANDSDHAHSNRRKKRKNDMHATNEDEAYESMLICGSPANQVERRDESCVTGEGCITGDASPRLGGKHVDAKKIHTCSGENFDVCSSAGLMEEGTGHAVLTESFPSPPVRTSLGSKRKKLSILDLNGVLVDIPSRVTYGYKADTFVANKPLFKKPFCDDFLEFLFQNYDMGVWSSRSKKNVDTVVDVVMGESRKKLLFCGDQKDCTKTADKTLENKDKPLVFKELKKIWSSLGKGAYDESNTILSDDSPYKALRNLVQMDISHLRVYLERLLEADNVQKYVEENPFGQPAITAEHPNWKFYHQVMNSIVV